MADVEGFLKVGRVTPPKRPVQERIRDYRHVYTEMPRAVLQLQASRCMDCGVPFCSTACPLGNYIPDWNDLAYRDRWQDAFERLHATNNFPEFTGLLCPAPCEAGCVLAITQDAVTIKEIERSIIDHAFQEGWVRPEPPSRRSGRRVAVVGSGPAGLAAAQQLNRAGHRVTVFEKDDNFGGLLRYGIPDFKLEKWIIDRRLAVLAAEGIEFVANAHVGETVPVCELQRTYNALLLTPGALQGNTLDVPGSDLAGIHLAMDYLTQQNRRVAGQTIPAEVEITARDKQVVILGGGDTSADCLGNAHREGARSVQVLTHGPRPPQTADPLSWPDWPFILRTYPAHEEGGSREWSVAVTAFTGREGRVTGVQVVRVLKSETGHMVPVSGTERTIPADLVLLAIGFAGPVQDGLMRDLDLAFTPGGTIAADKQFGTSVPRVFVAGDARRGASLIVHAIAEGRKAARSIDAMLTGQS